ncbi:MAG: FMN-binding protein [Elusimicrobia bacterium]|nr:FMN-binding protein [Elusimicrobiota bacterium]
MKNTIFMILFILVLGGVLSTVIVTVNHFTEPLIIKNNNLMIQKTVLEAQNMVFQKNEVEKIFSDNIKVIKKGSVNFYVLKNKDIAFELSGSGLWGPIKAVISLFSDLKTIKKIRIIHQEETPGLGGELANEKYLQKFHNKTVLPRINIVNRVKAEKDNEVDGITGATMTCKAFEKILNTQISEKLSVYRGN